MKNITVLTGAGISAESGIRTFRDSDGLWENHRVEDVASPQGFAKNPVLVWDFYKARYQQSLDAEPNPAHYALTRLEEHFGDSFNLITQNVDGLHIRAGNTRVYEMHGRLAMAFCSSCRSKTATSELDFSQKIPICTTCGGNMRADIVWFGEIPYYLYEIDEILKNTDFLLILGTSGVVYPAAGFVMTAKIFGATTIAVNLEEPENRRYLDEFYPGKCGELVPQIVDKLIQNYGGR
ncbi:MAG: NAD-dependent deacylase [Candidatus Cloacimonetes bacterium]|nr:NAD-dependent deacylase [Candidatus Cloacimonadota bacterium]